MVYYSEEPCNEQTVNCLLFPKDLFTAVQRQLRTHIATRPPGARERLAWMRRTIDLIRQALSHTNILDTWLLGDWAPTDIENVTGNRKPIRTLDPGLWPRAGEAVFSLSRRSVQATPAQGIVYFPLTSFKHYAPWVGYNGAVLDQYGYLPSGELFLFHQPEDFRLPVGGGVAGLAGLGNNPLAATGAARMPQLYQNYLSPQVRAALVADGVDLGRVYEPAAWNVVREQALTHHVRLHTGDLVSAESRSADGRSIVKAVLQPSATHMMNYYAALANDVLETPYEVYILWGMQQWAENLAVWSQRGRINVSSEQIMGLAREITTARNRVYAQGGFMIATSLMSMANPIFGAVMQALSLISDLLIKDFGAVGFWNCPYPLTRRSAGGDCDYGTVIGPEALERAARQREGMTAYFTPPPAPSVDEGGSDTASSSISPLVVGGGVIAALAAVYYLLQE